MQNDPEPPTTNRGAEPAAQPDIVESAVRSSYLAQRAAMVAGNAEALSEQLADGFTLTRH